MKQTILILFAAGAMAFLSACAGSVKDESKDEPKKDEPKQEATVDSDLKIVDLTPGAGDGAKTGDTVLVNYTGWLYEGGKRTTQFDSSLGAGREPFVLTIGRTSVIRGWTQGLVGMKVGGKRQLIIPPDLAYGPGGRPPVIPPNSTLEFEIELLKITKA